MKTADLLIALAGTLLVGVAQAATVYRCEQGGRTVFSDLPCEAPKPPANGVPAPAGGTTQIMGAYETPYGEWRGQAQFQATANGQRIEAAHALTQLVLRITPDGKLIGRTGENACKLLGLASPGFTPQMLNLDLTLQNCARPELNKRFFGTLTVNARDKVARLHLNHLIMGIGGSTSADVSAVMRR